MTKRIFLVLTVLSFAISSCSKQDIDESNLQTELQVTKNILNFDSSEDINNKINLIKTLKNEKETIVLDEMFNSKNAPSIEISEQTELTEDLINYVKEYHQRKLENIYSIRGELGFTSIQSIADEINSLKLINPSKATKLFDKYDQHLNQGRFLVEPNMSSGISEVLNLEGKLMLKNDLKDYSQENQSTINNRGPIAVAAREDILVENDFYAITWHAGFQYFDNGNPYLSNQYTPFTKLASWVKIGTVNHLFPSRSSLFGSQATFLQPFGVGGLFQSVNVSFGSSPNLYIAEIDTFGEPIHLVQRHDASFYVTGVQMGSGSFNTFTLIPTIDPFLNLTSSSFSVSF